MMINIDNIHEMKCPYCGDMAMQEYGDMDTCGYECDRHYVVWNIDCPICEKHYFYTEEFVLVYASPEKN